MAKIGIVGLGNMGLPMAINLIKNHHEVTGFDIEQGPLKTLAQAGAIAASSLQQAAHEQEFIITMLQSDQQVLDVLSGAEGLLAHANAQCIYMDCSTIDVAMSKKVHDIAQEKGIKSLDAPVSGGVAGAIAATLTFMVGGEMNTFNQACSILYCLGKKIIYAGPAGSGQAAKVCNNMVLGISMIAICEAFSLAKHLNLDEKKLFEVMNHASGQCWALSHYVPVPGILKHVPANNQYQPGFSAKMMLKDLLLSQNAAENAHVKTPLGEHATQLYQYFIDEGLGERDFSAIIQWIEQQGTER